MSNKTKNLLNIVENLEITINSLQIDLSHLKKEIRDLSISEFNQEATMDNASREKLYNHYIMQKNNEFVLKKSFSKDHNKINTKQSVSHEEPIYSINFTKESNPLTANAIDDPTLPCIEIEKTSVKERFDKSMVEQDSIAQISLEKLLTSTIKNLNGETSEAIDNDLSTSKGVLKKKTTTCKSWSGIKTTNYSKRSYIDKNFITGERRTRNFQYRNLRSSRQSPSKN